MIRRFCRGIITLMARCALGAQSLECAGRAAFMTRLAIRHRMRAEQRETVRVIVHGRKRNAPSPNGMTLLAVASHLAAMKIGMTIGALLSDAGEYLAGMTLPAVKPHVHPAKRKSGFRVLKIREWPNRPKTRRGVTISAGNSDRSVRAAFRLHIRVA
jgi:hypothetical protein